MFETAWRGKERERKWGTAVFEANCMDRHAVGRIRRVVRDLPHAPHRLTAYPRHWRVRDRVRVSASLSTALEAMPQGGTVAGAREFPNPNPNSNNPN